MQCSSGKPEALAFMWMFMLNKTTQTSSGLTKPVYTIIIPLCPILNVSVSIKKL